MTTPKTETTLDWAELTAKEITSYLSVPPSALNGRIAAALRQVRSAALEKAAKAMCKLCAEGEYEALPCRNHWHHYAENPSAEAEEDNITEVGDCRAGNIRSLMEQK